MVLEYLPGIIEKNTLGVNVGKYSSTMDPLGMLMEKYLGIPMENGYIYDKNYWLVVWNMNGFFFHSVGNFIIPTDFQSIIFQRGRSTTNQ